MENRPISSRKVRKCPVIDCTGGDACATLHHCDVCLKQFGMEPKLACDCCDKYKICRTCVNKEILREGVNWRCRRCRSKAKNLARKQWTENQLWISRSVSISNTVGTACDLQIPLYGNKNKSVLYWKAFRSLMRIGIQRSIENPQRLIWIILAMKFTVLRESESTSFEVDSLKDWLLEHFLKHDSFYGQVRDSKPSIERFQSASKLFKQMKYGINPPAQKVNEALQFMFDAELMDVVC